MAGQTEDPAQDPQSEQSPGTTQPDPNATVETPTTAAAPPVAEPSAAPEPSGAHEPPAAPVTSPDAAEPAAGTEPAAAPPPTPAGPAPDSAAAPPPVPAGPAAEAPDAAGPEPAAAAPPAPAGPAAEAPAGPTSATATPEPSTEATEQSGEYPWLRSGGGQHAVPRPYPPTVARVPMAESMATPPDAAGGPAGDATAPMPADPGATATLPPQGTPGTAGAAAAGAAAGGPGTIAPTGPAQPATRRAQLREPAELPELPPKPGFARHALGFLVGLVVTPIALVLTGAGVGGFRALDPTTADQAFDATNFSLIAVGVALLVAVVMLALWSPAVPLTGGLVWGVGLGVLYLGWPSTVEGWIDQAYSSRPDALNQLVTTLNDGTWLVLGLLLAAAGLAVSVARRMGRRFGEHTTLATHARIEATRAEETRRQAADAEEAARAERARSIT